MSLYDENGIIIYLSSNLSDKQYIEDGLNRRLTTVSTLRMLVEQVELSIARYKTVNIIMTTELTKELKGMVNELLEAIDTLSKNKEINFLFVTIGYAEKVIPFALDFGDIPSFINYARNHDREQQVKQYSESTNTADQEQARIMMELLNEVDSYKERELKLTETIKESADIILGLESTIKAMKHDINYTYKNTEELNSKKIQQMEEELSEVKRQLSVEQRKVQDYEMEVNKLRNDNKSMEIDLESLKTIIEDRKNDIEVLNQKIESYEQELTNRDGLESKLYSTRIEKEKYVLLDKQLQEETKNKIELENQLKRVQVDKRTLEYKLQEKEQHIEMLREGDADISLHGRTMNLDNYTFKNTNMFYFKIVKELPYLNSHLSIFVDLIKEKYDGDTVVCIIKADEGLNTELFGGVQVYGSLGDVPVGTDTFLLYPSQRMFSRAEKFEQRYSNIIIIDYIQSKSYHATSSSMERIYTVVRYTQDVRRLDLKGKAISLESDSILDIRYDPKIFNTQMESTAKNMITGKVKIMMNKDGI